MFILEIINSNNYIDKICLNRVYKKDQDFLFISSELIDCCKFLLDR